MMFFSAQKKRFLPVRADNASHFWSKHEFERKFICPEESMRYAGSLEQIVFNKLRKLQQPTTVIEFGSGAGSPVIAAILNSGFLGIVHGYEINPEAAETAARLIEQNELGKKYVVYNESFFESIGVPKSDYLIANPPYIPADDSKQLTLPYLCGGPEGMSVSQRLLSLNYQNVFLEVSSYSNPGALVGHAKAQGYKISDFQITYMPFGVYSRQEIVQKRLYEMRRERKAFFTDKCYLVGSAFFTRENCLGLDLSGEFLSCLTSLGQM